MSFPPAFMQQLRDALPISEVVGKRLRLTRKGREWTTCCPFHKEKTPSFYVNDEKQFYHCFGCGAHGDAIGFMKEYEGLDFAEAVERLAAEAGLAVPQQERLDPQKKKQQQDGYALMQAASDWFRGQLTGPLGRKARDYIGGRGLKRETVEAFGLGYAPDTRDALKSAMLSKGFSERQLIQFGLLIPSERGAPYDRFRGRLMFPIQDRQGRVVAFGGRILGQGEPKYLNSPETPLFHKGNMLYAAHLARKAAHDAGQLIAVEGYMDVIALWQAGLRHAVAPLGTAVTEAQLRQCWAMAREPVFCLDGDAAGLRAMKRVAELAVPLLQPGYFLRFSLLPEGEDPDTLVKHSGPAGMQALLRDALPLSQMLWRQAKEEVLGQGGKATPEKLATLENTLQEWAGRFTHPALQRHMQEFVQRQCRRLTYEARQQGGAAGKRNAAGGRDMRERSSAFLAAARKTMHRRHGPGEALLLALILRYPALLDDAEVEEQFATWHFQDVPLRQLQEAVMLAHGSGEGLSSEGLKHYLRQEGYEVLWDALMRQPVVALARFCREALSLPDAQREWRSMMQEIQRGSLQQERQQQALRLQEELSEAEWERYLATVGAATE